MHALILIVVVQEKKIYFRAVFFMGFLLASKHSQ